MQNMIILIIFLLVQSLSESVEAKQSVAYSLVHGLQRTQLYDTTKRLHSDEPRPFLLSPDGKRLFTILGRGNVENNTYEFMLAMFDLPGEVSGGYPTNRAPTGPTILAKFNYDRSNRWEAYYENTGIKNIKFAYGGRALTFIARSNGNSAQVYIVDIHLRNLRQLTFAKNDIIDYIFIEKTGEVITLLPSFVTDDHCGKDQFVVDVKSYTQVMCTTRGRSLFNDWSKNDNLLPLRNDIVRFQAGTYHAAQTIAKSVAVNSFLTQEALSPDGRYLVVHMNPVLSEEQIKDLSERLDYLELYNPSIHSKWITFPHYAVLDISKGTILPIKEAQTSQYYSSHGAFWVNNNVVKLLDVKIKNGLDTIGGRDAIVDDAIYDVHQNKIIDYARSKKSLSANGFGERREKYTVRKTNVKDIEYYCRKDDNLLRVSNSVRGCYVYDAQSRRMIMTGEKYDNPPNIIMYDLDKRSKFLLFELNPQFRNIEFAKVELFQWRDQSGELWEGGLVYPKGYVPGRRYPIVIQTHGFDGGTFLLDGPFYASAPFAAQALASREMFVLQMPDAPIKDIGQDWVVSARGLKGAIEKLDRTGKIDIKKIGLLGYSATGSFVFNVAIFPDYPPAAVLINDAFSPSPFGYFATFGGTGASMIQSEKMYCGANPWNEKRHIWYQRNPLYHLDRLRAPVLLTQNIALGVNWWDIYAGLRRLGVPVEFRIFQKAAHPPVHLSSVKEMQNLTVAWFDFWLNKNNKKKMESHEYVNWKKMADYKWPKTLSSVKVAPLSQHVCGKDIE